MCLLLVQEVPYSVDSLIWGFSWIYQTNSYSKPNSYSPQSVDYRKNFFLLNLKTGSTFTKGKMFRTDGVSLKPCSPRTKEDEEKPDPLGDPPPLPNNASHYNIGKPSKEWSML